MTPSSTAEPPIEVESALVVRADQPAEVLAKIAALRTLARWTLEPLTPQTIEDVYFDASDGSLGARRIAVRVRRVDGQVLLALKSGLRREGDVTTRIEIEA